MLDPPERERSPDLGYPTTVLQHSEADSASLAEENAAMDGNPRSETEIHAQMLGLDHGRGDGGNFLPMA